jgi:hypothetical protein
MDPASHPKQMVRLRQGLNDLAADATALIWNGLCEVAGVPRNFEDARRRTR